jgi:hypothetical protein
MKLEHRQHIVYAITIAGAQYIGCTNIEPRLGIEGSLRRRIAKHWYRLKDAKRSKWALYKALATVASKEQVPAEVIVIKNNKAEAHSEEQRLIKLLDPKLNSDKD